MRKVLIFVTIIAGLFFASISSGAGIGTKHAPDSERISIYESVKPSPVRRKPEGMHVGGKNSDDMSIEMGDIRLNPIPNTR